ncbi:MAG: protein-L-isoaspartate(D-aspartate) O-methyltransferase [Gammaproteobacteria bacterium]|nr:protein-L-isoaspartate(D-aspartate) O-methyltransferase [Gammaproteobacteria bacterium]MBU1655061.1 protein-L-isoaspartate(D-aspartate) O-methyltransferase [Gammaproteobacteria bacterium]MBU1961760.1 protein-L-isoaspartate(D-aspartate) O-methyltransferase [Gammaproteobacteria bacterium]
MRNQRIQGIGMTSQRTRERLIARLKEEGIRDLSVLNAIRETPRHLFVDEALASRAYEDSSLPISHGQTISQPYIVARMTEALLEGGPLQRVLEVGTGSGYQAAVLARLVRHVFTLERIEALLSQAQERFRELGLRNIRTKYRDGGMGMPECAPFDGIMVTAAPEGIPLALVRQLEIGGRMVLPVGDRDMQVLVRVTRTEEGYEKEMLERVVFVPLLGGVA